MTFGRRFIAHFAGIHRPLLIMTAIYLGQTLEIVSPETRRLIALMFSCQRVHIALGLFFVATFFGLGYFYEKSKDPDLGK